MMNGRPAASLVKLRRKIDRAQMPPLETDEDRKKAMHYGTIGRASTS